MTIAKKVRIERDYYGRPMQEFEFNGKIIKTNFDAFQYPMWDGNGIPAKYTYKDHGYHRRLEFGESEEEALIKAVEAGYTEIRFVETSTMVRGYHNVYIWMHRKEEK